MNELKMTPGAIRSREYRQRMKRFESLKEMASAGKTTVQTLDDYRRRDRAGTIRYPLSWGSGLKKNREGSS